MSDLPQAPDPTEPGDPHPTATWEGAGHGATLPDLRLPPRWRLERRLGAGGQGEVWLATDRTLDQPVAVKVLRSELDPAGLERLRREVGVGRTLAHPHLLRIHELVESDGTLAVVMEWMPAGSLATLMKAGPLPVARVVEVAEQLLEALAYLHQRGIVHRDVKPSNILLAADETVRLGDFGLIRPLDPAQEVTRTRTAVGTLAYMSPAQIRGEQPAPSSDLYSLGITLYALLAGELPFTGDSDYELMAAHLNRPAFSLARRCPSCPRWLSRFVMRLLEKRAGDRWPDAGAALAAFRSRRGLHSPRRWRRVAVSLAVVATAGGVAWTAAQLGNPAPVPVNATAADHDVVAFNADERELWRHSFGNPVGQTLVADVFGDHRAEVAVSVSRATEEGAELSDIALLSGAGQTLAVMPAWSEDGSWVGFDVGPGLRVHRLAALDLEGRGLASLVWLVRHPTHYPSLLAAAMPRSKPQPRPLLLNSGHLDQVVAADLDDDGRPELVTWGLNNPMGFQQVVAVLAPAEDGVAMSPDHVHLWREGLAGRSVLAYTPLGPNLPALSFERSAGGFALVGRGVRFELDRNGVPAAVGAAANNAGAQFWRDVAELCTDLESEGATGAPLAPLERLHPALLGDDAYHRATLLLVARSLARHGSPVAGAELLASQLSRHGSSATVLNRAGELLAIGTQWRQAHEQLLASLDLPAARGPERLATAASLVLAACLSGDDDALWRNLQLAWSAHPTLRDPLPREDALALRAFFRGEWDDAALDPRPAPAGIPYLDVLRAWAALERGGDPAVTLAAAERLAGDAALTTPARLLASAAELRAGRPERALGLARDQLTLLRRSGRESLADFAWLQLAEGMVARSLLASGHEREAAELFADARRDAPGTWFGKTQR